MNFNSKKITVFGLGKSGLASARKLVSLGAKVFVTDSKPAIAEPALNEIKKLGIEVELGGHTPRSIQEAELIIVSPGIHLDIPVLEEAKERKIPIISEIELAYQLLTKPIIAVTGTNGKTTTTTLIGEMLRAGDKKVAVAGNIGKPLVEVDDTDLAYVVAEISSYQLETIDKFKPWISVILNIQEDHLERHHSIPEYIRQKARIFSNQMADDHLVYNQDDPQVKQMVLGARCQTLSFSKAHSEILALDPEEIRIPGRHNLENSLAAAQAAYLCGVSKNAVADVLRTFPGVEHRIEFVKEVKGIKFYNDSKATNPDSTLVALDTFRGRGIILILGGRDKGVSLDAMVKAVKAGVKDVVLIGEAADRFKNALEKVGYKDLHSAGSMTEAVKLSFRLGKTGDIILLSPACASFDLFINFEDRGDKFKQAVRELTP